jgi:putative FmdB family regulatory protein
MPTYTYCCSECDNSFEIYHSILDGRKKFCSKCNAVAKRQIGAGAGVSATGGSKKDKFRPPPPPSGRGFS